ncbi:MAG: LysM peptidoglycan-binding domain-containing protein [Symploca sp. SIO2E9]|nr:LysM peptidoglycan-binding domain-containing protein [Symploca sp. SIO2E9]
MTAIVQRKTSVSFGVVTELTVANETVNLILEKIQDRNVTVYRGGMITGQRLLVVALLEELIPELDAPDSIRNLAITQLAVELRPDKGSFAFNAAIENAWSITLDSGPTLAIRQLALSVLSVKPPAATNGNTTNGNTAEALSQQRKLAFEGLFELFGGEFALRVAHQFSSTKDGKVASQWGFSATASNISITEVIKAFGFSQDKVDEYGLRNLVVSLAFTLQQTRYKDNNSQIIESNYTFRGELLWDTGIELVPGEQTLQIEAAIQITKISSNKAGAQQSALQGMMAGTVRASIPFFDTLQLSVIYTFTQTSSTSGSSRLSQSLAKRTGELIFRLQLGTLLLSAVYTNVNNRKLLQFSISLVNGKNPTIGDLIAYIVSLYDPSITDFELDPPWDEFAKQEIALNKFTFEVDLTQKSVTISYKATVNVLIAKVSNLGLSYQFGTSKSQVSSQRNQARTASNKKVAIAVDLSIPGQSQQRVQWDPVNENPPAVPGSKAPIFDLKFLALGQKVAFAPEIVQQARTIEQFTNVMRQTLVPLPPIKRRQNPLTALQQSLPSAVSSDPTQPISFSGQPIIFSAESGWLIGAQFSILGAFELSVIFNDPFIYGLRISLSGPLVKAFAGLEFEILYRRISDTVGVYRTELVLPDAMRYLQFGAVSITLPVVAIEIYTNGDFGIDVGFPWSGDFSRSIAVNVGIFLGVGGFYFNKLSAETATSVPVVTNGTFNPVLEFGIGLKVGLGKIIKKGPLRAEMSITIHGILQGVFATFNPTDTSQNKVTYYKVQGGVGIVGRLYGVVDFKVIQVDIEVLVSITVLFVVEVYKAIQVALVAKVSVRASIKIAFVRIKFKFNLTVREQFVLGSDSKTPWRLAAASGGAMAVNIPRFAASRQTIPVDFTTARRSAVSRERRQPLHRSNGRGNYSFSPVARFARTEVITNTGTTANTSSGASTGGTENRGLRWENNQTAIKLAKPDKIREQTWVNDKLRLDIYFQPSFTRTDIGVSGISLLFIENSIPIDEQSQSDKDTDFDELVKALFKWVIYAALTDDERNNLTANDTGIDVDDYSLNLKILEEFYTLFTDYLEQAPADDFWEPLIRFLQENFTFEITDRPIDNNDISGTIFPIFPQLTMLLEDRDDTDNSSRITRSFDSPKYSPAKIKAIRSYFQNLNKNHDQVTDENLAASVTNDATNELAIASGAGATASIAQLLFIDYFTLIIRSALQHGIDYIRDGKEGVNNGEITVVGLLDKLGASVNDTENYPLQDLAGMTSRFLLHGLRLPVFADNNTDINGYTPVYLETGQQFEIKTTNTDTGIAPNVITLNLSNSSDLTWIVLRDYDPDSTQETKGEVLVYPFPDTTISNINAINSVALANLELPAAAQELTQIYDNVAQRYTIRQKTYWNQAIGADKNLLWELPSGLSDYLKSNKSKPETATLTLFYNQQVQEGEAFDPKAQQITAEYTWATKLTLEIRRVSKSDVSEFLPTVYALERIDTTSEQLLRDILETGVTPTTVTLLYLDDSSDSKVITRNASAEVLMLKTNLSVEANDNLTVTLETSDNNTFRPFLKLVQESNIISSGGYYLNYGYTEGGEQKGLPDSLFADGETAKVTLLMTFSSTPASYNNCLNIPSTHPQINALESVTAIFAESSEITQVLRIPAGNLGLRLVRDAIEAKDDDTATKEIENLYQLLSYQLPTAIAADFQTGQEYLPIGPFEDDITKKWVYEKVLPVYALTTEAIANSTALPEVLKDTLNPYYGMGDTFKLDFQWQDIYGNRLGEEGKLQQLSQTLGYFDPIFGINQWPSVGESYRITKKDDSKANLTLELVLDQSKYIPTPTNSLVEALEQIKTDRATYQQIYYQVHDSNLTFTAKTSVSQNWSHDLTTEERSVFTGFVDNVYKYLVTLEYLTEESHSVSSTETLQEVQLKYGVELVDLADINSAVSGIFSGNQDIQIPVGIRVFRGDNLSVIANKLIKDHGNPSNKVEEIVKSYAQTTELLAAYISIPDLDNYIIQSGDTWERIAINKLALAEDQLIATELRRLGNAISTESLNNNGLLWKGLHLCDLRVGIDTSLEEIAYGLLQLEAGDTSIEDETALTDEIKALVEANQDSTGLLTVDVEIPELGERIQIDDTFITIRDRVLTAEGKTNPSDEDKLDALYRVAQAARNLANLFVADAVLVKQNPIKITTNTTLKAIAITALESELAGAPVEDDTKLANKINGLVNQNQNSSGLLETDVSIPALNETTQSGDTFITIRDRVLTTEGKTNPSDAEKLDALNRVAQAVRAIEGLLVANNVSLNNQIKIKVITGNTLNAIATAFNSIAPDYLEQATPTETAETIAIANANIRDLLSPGTSISTQDDNNNTYTHTVESGDSFRQIAIKQVIQKNTNLSEVLKANKLVELDTLEYDVVPIANPDPSSQVDPLTTQVPYSLIGLTYNLNLATNQHRTVFETLQVIGNISDILTKNAIAIQLSTVATAVSNISGLFGSEDIILDDVLFNYTVNSRDSFEKMITTAAEHDSQILTDQTTAADIALKNSSLVLSGGTLFIPNRFRLLIPSQTPSINAQLALKQSTAETSSLANLAISMGNGITAAAVAIANQSLVELLSANHSLDILPVLASLTDISYDSNLTVNSDLEHLATFIDNQSIQTGSEETLYTLKSLLAQEVLHFQNKIDAEASQTLQSIGAVGAIYEQLTFEGANLTSLHSSLETAFNQLKTTLLVEVNGNTLKPEFQPSTVHNTSTTTISVEIEPALTKIEAAITQLNSLKNSSLTDEAKTEELSAIQTLLQDALYARKDDSSSYANEPLDGIHRIYELSCLKTAVDLLEKRAQRPITIAEVGIVIQNQSGLIVPGKNWIVPPPAATTTLEFTIRDNNSNLQYPPQLLFPVTVQLEMRRTKNLMHSDSVPEAQSISAYFSPKTIALTSSPDDEDITTNNQNTKFKVRLASLELFANAFEEALPNLKLAVGRDAGNIDNANPQNSDTLWAVHLGDTGISYNIKEDFPFFFCPAPLSNTLLSGTIQLYQYTAESGLNQTPAEPQAEQVNAVDINGLARIYLRAIEDILKPEIAVPAVNETTVVPEVNNTTLKAQLERILKVKASLADSITNNVTHVLETTLNQESAEYTYRLGLAKAALNKELLTNLADGYDIETIVQYNVDVAIANGYQWSNNDIPRLSGQPTITGAHYKDSQKTPNSNSSDTAKRELLQSLDFTLSPAKIALDAETNNGKSNLTFFFNTQTPQRYEDIAVNLMYQVNELEYNINTQNSTSSWLNFVVPLEDAPNRIGDVQIPIPLRDYPLSPSLIAHKAVPDPDSFSGNILSAEDIRDWNYIFLYEHPDVAQDTIECRIEYNGLSKLTISDVSLNENQGTAMFTVTLSPPCEQTVTVDYQTKDGTAKQPGDYIATSGTLEFTPGQTSKEIPVTVNSDNVVENNETFTFVLSNSTNAEIADPVGVGTIIDTSSTIDPLLDTLVRFNNLYPTLTTELKPIETGITTENRKAVTFALDAFATLAEEVARSWQNWQPIALAQASRQTVHYNINEDLSVNQQTKTVTIEPTTNLPAEDKQILEIELPGYQLDAVRQDGQTKLSRSPGSTEELTIPDAAVDKSYQTLEFDFSKLPDATGVETFGESALPDRKVTITNLDVLDYQNAWGAIRLARNKNLIDGMETNPAFIFETPEVRFKNRITPLIINDKRWDIAELGSSRTKTLEEHLQELFKVLLPSNIKRPYDLRVACQYAFALATMNESTENQDELLASLPVLLTPRFTVQKTEDATTMLEVTAQLRTNIATEIQDWWNQKQPNQANGRYLFSFSLFSNAASASVMENPNLPLLTVENLNLTLTDIIES